MLKITTALVGITLVCTLSACGGGGNSGSTSNLQVSPTQASIPSTPLCASIMVQGTPASPSCHITIYMAGDSTNWGVDVDNVSNEQQSPGVGNGVVGRASRSPAQLMQSDMDVTFGVGVVSVIDGSIPGSTLKSDLNGTPPSVSPLASRLAALPVHANIVLTNSEINDQYVLGENVSTYSSYASQWVQTVQAYGAVPVYQEPNPVCMSSMNIFDPDNGTNALVYTADQVFTTAGGYVLPNLSAWENYTTPPNSQPWNIAFMSSDCVHPNEAGYAFKEANYFPALLPVVKKLLGQ